METLIEGDRVRIIGDHPGAGVKGRLHSPGVNMYDWILRRDDTGIPMGVYEKDLERVRWWKFWRSRKEQNDLC